MLTSEKPQKNRPDNLTLSKRLSLAAGLVRQGRRVADVGCDHGKLSAFLLQSKKTPFVYATDIRPLPLEKAKELLNECGLEDKSCCLLTDGLNGVPGDQVDDVVIAGIGADVTNHVISEAGWLYQEDKHLVLVPASKRERVRRFLAAEGFETDREIAVVDAGHCYSVMSVYYTGHKRELSVAEAWIGKIDVTTEDGKTYLKQVRKRMEEVLAAVSDENNEHRIEAQRFMEEIDDYCK